MHFRYAFIAAALALTLVRPASVDAQAATPSPAPAGSASPGSSPSPAGSQAAATGDPAVKARAKEWLHRSQTGTIDHAQLDDTMNALLTDSFAKQIAAQLGPLGDPVTFDYVETRPLGTNTLYIYKVGFKTQTFYWLFRIGSGSKITGFQLVPPQQQP